LTTANTLSILKHLIATLIRTQATGRGVSPSLRATWSDTSENACKYKLIVTIDGLNIVNDIIHISASLYIILVVYLNNS